MADRTIYQVVSNARLFKSVPSYFESDVPVFFATHFNLEELLMTWSLSDNSFLLPGDVPELFSPVPPQALPYFLAYINQRRVWIDDFPVLPLHPPPPAHFLAAYMDCVSTIKWDVLGAVPEVAFRQEIKHHMMKDGNDAIIIEDLMTDFSTSLRMSKIRHARKWENVVVWLEFFSAQSIEHLDAWAKAIAFSLSFSANVVLEREEYFPTDLTEKNWISRMLAAFPPAHRCYCHARFPSGDDQFPYGLCRKPPFSGFYISRAMQSLICDVPAFLFEMPTLFYATAALTYVWPNVRLYFPRVGDVSKMDVMRASTFSDDIGDANGSPRIAVIYHKKRDCDTYAIAQAYSRFKNVLYVTDGDMSPVFASFKDRGYGAISLPNPFSPARIVYAWLTEGDNPSLPILDHRLHFACDYHLFALFAVKYVFNACPASILRDEFSVRHLEFKPGDNVYHNYRDHFIRCAIAWLNPKIQPRRHVEDRFYDDIVKVMPPPVKIVPLVSSLMAINPPLADNVTGTCEVEGHAPLVKLGCYYY